MEQVSHRVRPRDERRLWVLMKLKTPMDALVALAYGLTLPAMQKQLIELANGLRDSKGAFLLTSETSPVVIAAMGGLAKLVELEFKNDALKLGDQLINGAYAVVEHQLKQWEEAPIPKEQLQ